MTGSLSEHDLARERPYLLGIAYRMLGSASDAEDVVQEALVRAARENGLRSPRAFLTTVVTRLCLDELGSARRRRETYVGPYLPEPVATDGFDGDGEQRETVSLALLMLLDELSPLERAVFVLRELFELEFQEIGEALGRNEPACRKLLSRARERIAQREHRPPAPSGTQLAIANAFFAAIASGDLQRLVDLLAEEATLQADHGGKATAARNLLRGSLTIARFVAGIYQKGQRDPERYKIGPALVNGAPALVVRGANDALESVFVLQIEAPDGQPRIVAIHVVRNPDKLQRLDRTLRVGETIPVRVSAPGA